MKNIYIAICIAFYSLCWSQDDASTSLGLQLSANTITIGENAQSTFNTSENLGVVLTIAPQNNTTVKLSYDDSTEFTVVPDSIVFTTSNYNVDRYWNNEIVNNFVFEIITPNYEKREKKDKKKKYLSHKQNMKIKKRNFKKTKQFKIRKRKYSFR